MTASPAPPFLCWPRKSLVSEGGGVDCGGSFKLISGRSSADLMSRGGPMIDGLRLHHARWSTFDRSLGAGLDLFRHLLQHPLPTLLLPGTCSRTTHLWGGLLMCSGQGNSSTLSGCFSLIPPLLERVKMEQLRQAGLSVPVVQTIQVKKAESTSDRYRTKCSRVPAFVRGKKSGLSD